MAKLVSPNHWIEIILFDWSKFMQFVIYYITIFVWSIVDQNQPKWRIFPFTLFLFYYFHIDILNNQIEIEYWLWGYGIKLSGRRGILGKRSFCWSLSFFRQPYNRLINILIFPLLYIIYRIWHSCIFPK